MSPYSHKHLIALLVLVAASLPLAPVAALAHDDKPEKRTITISGKGTVKAAPDMVTISAGVESQAPTAKEALKNTAAMTKVVETLKSEGIDAKDIQTTNFSVSPRHEDRDDARPARIVGYAVYNTVYVTMHDTAKLGGVLDQLVTAGANSIGGISFGLDKPEPLQDEARKLAMADAMAKAKLYAEAAGAELGPVMIIAEQGGYVPRYPAAPMMDAAAASKAVPIEPGTEKIEIEVQVTWELK